MRAARVIKTLSGVNKKLLYTLPRDWDINVSTTRATKHLDRLTLTELISVIKSYEMNDKQIAVNQGSPFMKTPASPVSKTSVVYPVSATTNVSTSPQQSTAYSNVSAEQVITPKKAQEDVAQTNEEEALRSSHTFKTSMAIENVSSSLCSQACKNKVFGYYENNQNLIREKSIDKREYDCLKKRYNILLEKIEEQKQEISKLTNDASNFRCGQDYAFTLYKDLNWSLKMRELNFKMN